MSDQGNVGQPVKAPLEALQKQLVGMADMVESGFADSVLALIERDPSVAKSVRQDDYRAHKTWQRVDSTCVDLLARGGLSRDELRYVATAIKVAMDLKLMADESLRISQLISSYPAGGIASGPATDILPRMVEIAQSMLTDSIEAFVNRDSAGAQALHLVYRELDSLYRDIVKQTGETMDAGKERIAAGLSVVLVSRSMQAIGQHALDLANHVVRLYPQTVQEEEPVGEEDQ